MCVTSGHAKPPMDGVSHDVVVGICDSINESDSQASPRLLCDVI